MIKRGRTWGEISSSEWRGLFLVAIGMLAFGYYFVWWLNSLRQPTVWLLLLFVFATAYGVTQILGNWALYLATHWRGSTPSLRVPEYLSVDVFITACGESPALVERALQAAVNMRGQHQTWLLDDGEDPRLEKMARRLGAGYLVRNGRNDAKAGNLNAALSQTSGEIVVIFDVDHAPTPDFLERTLGYFRFPKIGFVQVMLTFENHTDGWVATAAADSSLDFYNPTSIGSDGIQSTTLIGSNALIRRAALESIRGYQPGLAEDLATSIALHSAGWRSVYLPEPLAPGYAPPDIAAWFTQQLKWARGVFELLLTAYPRYFRQMSRSKRVAYAVRMTYYWIGPVIFLHLLATLLALFSSNEAVLANFQDYLEHLAPLGIAMMIIRQLALRRWRRFSRGASLMSNLQIKPVILVFGTWPVYTLAWLMVLARLPLRFRPTPKTQSGSLSPGWMLPQVVVSLLLLLGLLRHVADPASLSFLMWGFAGAQLFAHVLLIVQWLRLSFSKDRPAFPLLSSAETVHTQARSGSQ